MYPNRVALSNDNGHTSIVSIARAKAIGTLQEDFSIGGGTFLIIPLTAGTIKVHFVGESALEDTYTISEVEVNASMGYPLPYLVDKVFKNGTTAQFNIGY